MVNNVQGQKSFTNNLSRTKKLMDGKLNEGVIEKLSEQKPITNNIQGLLKTSNLFRHERFCKFLS